MRNGQKLVLFAPDRGLYISQLRPLANGCFELRDRCSVGFQAFGKGVSKVAGVKNEHRVTTLGQISRNQVPA